MQNQNSPEDTRNLILAVVLCSIVFLVWTILFPPEEIVADETAQTEQTQVEGAATGTGAALAPLAPSAVEPRETALAKSERITIETPRLAGTINLRGARLDDLQLTDYNVRLNDPSEKVTLLEPAGTNHPYYVFYGWRPTAALSFDDVPGLTTEWVLEAGETLTPTSPVTIRWENTKGHIFRRTISIDNDYMFTIEQSVENTTSESVRMAPFGTIAQIGQPPRAAYGRQQETSNGVWILHEGIVRSVDGDLEELDYAYIPDEPFSAAENANVNSVGVQENGWIGFTGKYWMTTLIPGAGQAFDSVSKYTAGSETYQADMRLPTMDIAAGETGTITTSLFAGAKEYDAIKMYEEEQNIVQFVDSIDWGWFFFLTKPIFQVLHWLNGVIGNMGWAIIGLTLIIKAILFPLAYRSYVSMARMKELQPEMEKLKEKHGDDRQAMQQDMIALYKKKKVNPAAGCLPILLQVPIFFSLYKVIFVTLELRHAPFIGWIEDLSAPDPTSFLNLFGLLPWSAPDPASFFIVFSIGVWPILMGISMWLQQKLNPAPTDPIQAQVFAWLPWVFMFMLGSFASGLVVYWVANNMLTFTQQYAIMASQGVKPDIFGNIRKSFQRNKEG